jgi:hypothetical protein
VAVNARVRFRHFPTLAVVAVGIVAALLVASHAWSAKARPPGFVIPAKKLARVKSQLRSRSAINLSSLRAGTTLRVSRSAAEATAVRRFGRPSKGKVSAFAALATDKAWAKRQPNGKFRLQMSDRPVWVVLIPNFSMMGYHGMTFCVFIDATTGAYLEGATTN